MPLQNGYSPNREGYLQKKRMRNTHIATFSIYLGLVHKTLPYTRMANRLDRHS